MASPKDRWTQEELDKLAEYRKLGFNAKQIADRMGMTHRKVRGRITWQGMTGEQLEMRRERVRIKRMRDGYKSPHVKKPQAATGPVVTTEMLAERAIRLAAPCRDIAGMLFGDPPVGYSALERRV